MFARSIFKPALGIGLGIGLIVLMLSFTRPAASLENEVFDQFTRWQADPAKWSEDVVLLLVDEKALKEINVRTGWRWPWRRDAYAGLVAYLTKAEARAIVFDILFCEETDLFFDESFANAIQAAPGRVVLATEQRPNLPPLDPSEKLRAAIGTRLGFANVIKDGDGVARRYPLTDLWQHSSRQPLALMAFGGKNIQLPATSVLLLRWPVDIQALIRRERALSAALPVIEGLEIFDAARKQNPSEPPGPEAITNILRQRVLPREAERFKDKVVFIGCSAAATHDPITTPLHSDQPGVLYHATAMANLLHGDYLVPFPPWVRTFFVFMVALAVTAAGVGMRKIRWQIGFAVVILAGAGLLSYVFFSANRWLPPLMAMLAGLGSFTGVTTWQYFTEGKQKRWMRQLFSDFVSPDVLEELQQSPGGLNMRGDRRVGTVLFCDLAGFTTFTERAPPDQFIDAINAYLSDASQVLLARGAYIDKFIGDAVMAVFGVPKAQPDHALQACLASLELQAMMTGLNERLGRQYGVQLGLRTGINSGEMIAGAIGYARKLNYTVLGDTVNQASRFEGANKIYCTRIMIGPQTCESVRNVLEVRSLDFLRVVGKRQPVEVYELMGRKGELRPEQAALRAAHEEGVGHYRQRRWGEALACFNRVLRIDSQDGPGWVYHKRCESFQEHPPAADWDGSYGSDHK